LAVGLLGAFHAAAIDALDGADDGLVAALAALDGFGDFAHGRLGARGVHGEGEQVALGAGGGLGNRVQLGGDFGFVAFGLQARQLVQLHLAHGGIVHLQHRHVFVFVQLELVHADHGLRAAVDARLRARRLPRCAALGRPSSMALAMPPIFSTSRYAPWPWRRDRGSGVRHSRNRPTYRPSGRRRLPAAGRAACSGDAGGEVCRQGERLVEAVGVQRLRLAARGRDGLKTGADDVVVDVLRGQRPAGGLASASAG
jgi:hypothetical protein